MPKLINRLSPWLRMSTAPLSLKCCLKNGSPLARSIAISNPTQLLPLLLAPLMAAIPTSGSKLSNNHFVPSPRFFINSLALINSF